MKRRLTPFAQPRHLIKIFLNHRLAFVGELVFTANEVLSLGQKRSRT